MPRGGEPIPPCIARLTGALLSRAAQQMRERFEAALAPLGLRAKHYGLLLLLQNNGPAAQVDLGRQLWVDRTTMVALVDDLEKQNFVARDRHPDDRRAHAVTITDKGRGVLQKAVVIADGMEQTWLAPLSPAEREQLRDLLRRLLQG